MPQPETNDPLDALLREQDSYVDDNGFTARVMTSLPRSRRSWLRPTILCAATLLGLALLIWLFPLVSDAFNSDAGGQTFSLFNLQAILTLLAVVLSSASLGWGILKAVQSEE
ncbi:MAG TPA: hypothetical protein VFB72_13940 [Verrucomicrobiae bacterium]|nr:hypothetical protein [Verrucomicrobiae bacterium]